VIGDAVFSEDGRYRYLLTRQWAPLAAQLWAMFIMLNPSKAGAVQSDPTVTRCVGFAQRWGYTGLRVVNLSALVATDPKELRAAADPVGPDNDRHIVAAADCANQIIIAAWGVHADPARVQAVRKLLWPFQLRALGVTKDGHPRHPLYLANTTPLIDWPAAEETNP
jgi:hypothetical protein